MTERYFVDELGARTRRVLGPTGGGHLEIGKEVLAAKDVVPADSADVYTQMFRLKYARVVDYEGGLVEVEHRGELSAGQRRFLCSLEHAGKTLRYISAKH